MCSLLKCTIVLIFVAISKVDAFTPPPSSRNSISSCKSSSISSSSALSAIANPLKRITRTKKGTNNSNILRIESIQEYKEKVVNEHECITVVRFYSQYCKSCQASQPHFYKLASEFSKDTLQGIQVKFVEVPLTPTTKVLHEALDVPSLPWTHIYHPDAGLVEERAVSKKYINDVRKCLRCYVYGECELDDAVYDCTNIYGECAIDDFE